MVGGSGNTAVIATGVALVAASLGLGYMTLSAASARSSAKDVVDVDELEEIDDAGYDMITERDVCQIFDKLFLELQQAFAQLMNQVQQLQMAGQRIPEAQLQMIMRQELGKALATKQGAIVEDAGIDADCLEEAVWEFMDPSRSSGSSHSVRVAVERLQKLWQTATGDAVVGWRPGRVASGSNGDDDDDAALQRLLDPSETIGAAEAYFSALSECMRTLIASYRAAGKDLRSDPAMQRALNLDFAAAANDAGEAALFGLGITQGQFEAAVSHHRENAQVARALAMLQMKQGQEFAEMQA